MPSGDDEIFTRRMIGIRKRVQPIEILDEGEVTCEDAVEDCCPESGGSVAETIQTDCCEEPIPATFYITRTRVSPSGPTTVIVMTYYGLSAGGEPIWRGEDAEDDFILTLTCTTFGGLQLRLFTPLGSEVWSANPDADTLVCDPFGAVYTYSFETFIGGGFVSGSGIMTVSADEP